MTTSYPGAVDALINPVSTDPLSAPAHAAQHANANDAIEAIEATLGTDPQGSATTVKARMVAIETSFAAVSADAAAAALSANQSATSASASSASASAASASQVAAAASATAAADLYDQFDDRFLGAKTTNPTTDNDGNALLVGALYFNSVAAVRRVWTGTVWVNAVDTPYNWTGPIAISAASTSPALYITQTGTGDVIRLDDQATDTSPFRVDAAGALTMTATATFDGSVAATAATARFTGHGAVTRCTSTTRPASPISGDVIYETDTNLFYGYTGATWSSIGGGGSIAYQTSAPTTNLTTGVLWVDSDGQSSVVNANDFYTQSAANSLFLTQSSAVATYATKVELASAGYSPFLLMGA